MVFILCSKGNDNKQVMLRSRYSFHYHSFFSDSDSIWNRRSDLRGLHFRTGFPFNNSPYTSVIGSVGSNGTAVMKAEGYFGQILVLLSNALNATYSLVDTDGSKSYGGLQSDNVTFNGLVGMLQAGKIDLIVAELSVSELRARVCDFLIPIMEAKFRYN